MNKITIAIPTFNRLQKLKNTVSFFECEEALTNNEIEFIISNNASTDGTDIFLNELKLKYPNIIVNNNTVNEGLIGNLMIIATIATGDYIWFVGDDDEYCKGIINTVLNAINENDIQWLFIRHYFLTETGIIEPKLYCQSYYYNGLDLFNNVCASDYMLGAMMFISGSVYKLIKCKEAIEIYKNSPEYYKYQNLAFPLGIAFHCAVSGGSAVTEKEAIIDSFLDTSWAEKSSKVFLRDQIAILDLFAQYNGINLLKETCFERGLINKYPEWTFLMIKIRKHIGDDNYAMKYFLKHMPLRVVSDFFTLSVRKIFRNIKSE